MHTSLSSHASVTGDQLILETHVDLTWLHRPAMAFYPALELEWDPTNWWGPNPAAVEGMLRTVGFRRVEIVTPNPPVYRAARTARRAARFLRLASSIERSRENASIRAAPSSTPSSNKAALRQKP